MKSTEGNRQIWGFGTKPHGIHGACTLRSLIVEKYFPKQGDTVLLLPEASTSSLPKDGREYAVKRMVLGHKIMAEFEGIENRNQILEILPFKLMLPKEILCSFQDHQKNLLGFRAVDREGNTLGTVEGMGHNGVQDLVEIEGKETLILPVVDGFIKDINVEKKLLIVVVPTYV